MLMACENMVEMKDTNMEEMKVVSTPQPQRTTRKSLEDESLLGESTGSLWMGRGQQAYLFTNNNQRLLGDLLNVTIEGYPKEQIQTKINTISKLLAEILGEQRQQIEFKQNELKKQITPPEENPPGQSEVPNRGLASVENENDEENGPNLAQIQQQIKENDKELKKIGDESNEIAELKKARDLPIKSIATHIVEIQKDGNYRIRGEQPFMIGKREYKILVMGAVRSEDYNEQGISAEKLLDPTFDIISEKKIGEL
ncbi:MAG: flagellar basal body L-ring protein FlgH [Bdellovibrionaceae bacterium]|nr:flagellar basal body L-ring protein FlgH [Pseudobdellovibrionaceae bacterium]